MAHFAKLDSENNVIHVSVVDNDILIDEFGNESENLGIQHLTKVHGYSNWKQTSYNGSFRGCYASKGYQYNPELDIFIQPQPFPSWVLNKSKGCWEAPIPQPKDGKLYHWEEESRSWVEHEFEMFIVEEPSGHSPQDLIDQNN